jgi:hypothetical protein
MLPSMQNFLKTLFWGPEHTPYHGKCHGFILRASGVFLIWQTQGLRVA